MATTSVSARFQELFPETNLISLLTKYGGDADDIFETIQDRYDAHEQEPLVGLLGIKAANIDAFARAAYWDFVSDIRVRYLSSLPRSEAAAIAAAARKQQRGTQRGERRPLPTVHQCLSPFLPRVRGAFLFLYFLRRRKCKKVSRFRFSEKLFPRSRSCFFPCRGIQ